MLWQFIKIGVRLLIKLHEGDKKQKQPTQNAQDDGHLKHNISGGGVKLIKVHRGSEWPAPRGETRVQYVSASPPSARSCHRRWLHNSHLGPPASLSPRRSVCLAGRAFSQRPLPRELSPFLMSWWERSGGDGIPLREGGRSVHVGRPRLPPATFLAAVFTFTHNYIISSSAGYSSFFFFFLNESLMWLWIQCCCHW